MNDGTAPPSENRTSFPTTSWTLILQAQRADSQVRADQMWQVLRCYWKPLYNFYRLKSRSSHEAEELVQEFLQSAVTDQKLLKVTQPSGRFRDWLQACARNFLTSQHRRAHAKKRRPSAGVLSFEQLRAADGDPFEPPDGSSPEEAFRDAWRRDLLDRAFQAVETLCAEKGRTVDFQIFQEKHCCGQQHEPTWQQVAARHNLPDWKQAFNKADWVKTRLSQAIRHEVRQTVDSDAEVDDELRRILD